GNQLDKLMWDAVHWLPFYQVPGNAAAKQKLANFGSSGFASVIYDDIGHKKEALGGLRPPMTPQSPQLAASCSSRPWARVFQARVAHLMRTGNFTTPCRASRSPSFTPSSSSARSSPSASPSRRDSWMDISALKARISLRA